MSRLIFVGIVLAMIFGVAAGALVSVYATPAAAGEYASYARLGSDVFLRLIKMIVAPLILTTLSVGIAHIGAGSALGRIGFRSIAWFVVASLVSLCLGLVAVNLLRPGVGFDAGVMAEGGSTLATAGFSLREFITHVFPTSIVDAMARNEVLQIVVFSVFLGCALQALGERAAQVTALLEQGGVVMLKVTGYVMAFAPIAVFAAISSVIATQGFGVLADYGRLVGAFFLTLGVLWLLLLGAGFVVVGPRIVSLLVSIRSPILLAFATSSSEAAYPRVLERLERFGVANRVASFVLPLGYSFNLDGSMMYCTFAIMFIAQAMGVEISLGQQVLMLLMLMVTSKGIAGVPRASLVVISATLPTFGMPVEAIGLVIAVDAFMDMGRSATNVLGNSIACAAVAKWEGLLRDPQVEPAMVAEALDEASQASRPETQPA
jgi:Na+/H+-dicarboxylate symporter